MKTYDKQRTLEMVYQLASKKGMKIVELEETAGIGSGYLTRVSKPGNTTRLAVDTLDALADALGVSINSLITGELELAQTKKKAGGLSTSEKYIKNFLLSVLEKTEKRAILWTVETVDQLNNTAVSEWGEIGHPLFGTNTNIPHSKAFYVSDFVKKEKKDKFEYKILGDCLRVRMDSRSVLYLMNVSANEEMVDVPYFEMYIVQDECVSPICCAKQDSKDLYCEGLTKIYEAALAVYNDDHIEIEDEVKNSMDKFAK